MSINTFRANTLISALAELIDTSSDRYARSFGPLLADRKTRPTRGTVRPVRVFRTA